MRELKGGVYFHRGLPLAERINNRFGRMRDLAIFCGDTRNASLKKEKKIDPVFGLFSPLRSLIPGY